MCSPCESGLSEQATLYICLPGAPAQWDLSWVLSRLQLLRSCTTWLVKAVWRWIGSFSDICLLRLFFWGGSLFLLLGGWPVADGDARSELLSADWNGEWMRLQAARHRADDSFEWDKRARHFRPLETAPYARDFIKLLALKPGESVLDMGCGAGSIAIPLAQTGHSVIAADFSPAMLGTLDAGIEYYGLEDLITPLELAWDDDWDLVGPVAKAVDVAFASRSVTTNDLKGALAKLDRTARRRCAVTMIANSSPRYDLHLMNAIGASVTCSNGFVYAFNILIQMGALPQVTYFESPRRDTFDSLEAGVADFSRMLEHGNEDKIDRLRDYIAHHMIENPHAGEPGSKGVPQGRDMLDHIRKVRWAFIAWEPVSVPRP